jgi:hypothetical protein
VPVRARVVWILLLAALVGVVGGLAVGYLRQAQPASGGTATPLPAASPSVPIDPSPTVAPYADDIPYPPLEPGLDFERLRMGNSLQTWSVPVPKGWDAFTVFDVPVPDAKRDGYDELRFRPPGEPVEGGYSLRAKTINAHLTTGPMVAQRLAAIHEAYDEVTVLSQTEDSLKVAFRDGTNHLRYNYFRWFAAPGASEATLEMSVAGREEDRPGLEALFAAFDSTLRALD